MLNLAIKLKELANNLGISDVEAAKRCGLDRRRYGHYVTGRSEPDLATLRRIAEVLKTTPNDLLDFSVPSSSPQISRLNAACQYLNETQIEMLIDFAEASLRKSAEKK